VTPSHDVTFELPALDKVTELLETGTRTAIDPLVAALRQELR